MCHFTSIGVDADATTSTSTKPIFCPKAGGVKRINKNSKIPVKLISILGGMNGSLSSTRELNGDGMRMTLSRGGTGLDWHPPKACSRRSSAHPTRCRFLTSQCPPAASEDGIRCERTGEGREWGESSREPAAVEKTGN